MFKKIIQNLIRIIQKLLIIFLLTIIYFLGFGITLIFMVIFNRKVLACHSGSDDTFWIDAEGYGADMEDSVRQS